MKDILKLGMKVRCVYPVQFIDGTRHKKDDIFTITPDNIDYFINYFGENYEIIHEVS